MYSCHIFFFFFRNGDDNDYILDNNNSSYDKTLRIFSVSVGLQCLSLFCHIRTWLVCIMNNLEKLVLLFLQRKCTIILSQNIV